MVHSVDFQPVGRRGQCREHESVLNCARRLGVGISTICGGVGTCGTCKVRILSGTASEPAAGEKEAFSTQELSDGWRLACQVYPTGDLRLHIPPESMTTPQRIQLEGLEIKVPLEPPVRDYYVKLPVPSLSDHQADAERLIAALNEQCQLHCQKIDFAVLRFLTPQLRAWDWQLQASVRDDEVVAVAPWPSRQLGLAVDLGTTKIAGYLIDLSDGRTLAAKGTMNPQISYGEDVISRINAVVNSTEGGAPLQAVAVAALNGLANDLCGEVGAKTEEIVEAVVVGNTAMHHLLLGLPVRQLALSPFVPAVSGALDIKARELGWHIAPGAYLHLLPNIAGFVGADHVAMLLATMVRQAEGPVIALDIGTNTEVSLVHQGKITAVSCASGPAFEGGHIKDGMRAARGAIERVRITKNKVEYQTIDNAPPVGICGSGIVDTMAQLYLAGIIDKGGRMKDSHPRVRNGRQQREFVLVTRKERERKPAIVFTQPDVRQLQLGKAAIRAGIQIVLEANNCTEEEIKQVIIAGAFGSYIDVSSAVAIGMLPALPLERFQQVGNAAGMGAKRALISLSQRAEAQSIASQVRYLELGAMPEFNQTFVQAMYLGRYRIRQGQREDIE